MDLDAFISAELDISPYPGQCTVMADKWFRAVRGFSVIENYGERIETEIDVESVLEAHSNMVVGINRAMRAAGCKKTDSPKRGDVGLIVLPPDIVHMAICTGDAWVSRDNDGMVMAPMENLWKAWSV